MAERTVPPGGEQRVTRGSILYRDCAPAGSTHALLLLPSFSFSFFLSLLFYFFLSFSSTVCYMNTERTHSVFDSRALAKDAMSFCGKDHRASTHRYRRKSTPERSRVREAMETVSARGSSGMPTRVDFLPISPPRTTEVPEHVL